MSSSLTLTGWQTSAATALVEQLPLTIYTSALLLVQAYLSSIGGWISDDPSDATGLGMPANGQTPDEAAASITTAQYANMYKVDVTAVVTVRTTVVVNLIAGQSNTDVISAIEPTLSTMVEAANTPTMAVENLVSYSGTVHSTGTVSPTDRVTIAALIPPLTDPCAIALEQARLLYGLDDTWNVASFYTDGSSGQLVVSISKYTDVTFSRLDSTSTTNYLLSVGLTDYACVSGLEQTSAT